MQKDRTCKYCDTLFENIEGRVFSNHVRWCDKNLTTDKGKAKLDAYYNSLQKEREALNKTYNLQCQNTKCRKQYILISTEKNFLKKTNFFCSRSCANAKIWSTEDKQKKRIAAINSEKVKSANESRRSLNYKDPKLKIQHLCNNCSVPVTKFCSNLLKLRFCSRICKTIYISKYPNLDFKVYKSFTRFSFALKSYPDEFDFNLIRKHGWYKAANHGNNLDGISRDHMFSVNEGFLQGIEPSLLAHPANCRLIQQRENSRKHKKSSITYEELLERIRIWDLKYPKT